MIIVEQQYSEERYLGTDTHITDDMEWNQKYSTRWETREYNRFDLLLIYFLKIQ